MTDDKPEFTGKMSSKENDEIEEEEETEWQETIKALDMTYFVINLICYVVTCLTMIFIFSAYVDDI